MPTYKIIRFRFQGENEVIATGLTLAEAQAHCNDESTHGGDTEDGTAWFDGYEAETEVEDEEVEDECVVCGHEMLWDDGERMWYCPNTWEHG